MQEHPIEWTQAQAQIGFEHQTLIWIPFVLESLKRRLYENTEYLVKETMFAKQALNYCLLITYLTVDEFQRWNANFESYGNSLWNYPGAVFSMWRCVWRSEPAARALFETIPVEKRVGFRRGELDCDEYLVFRDQIDVYSKLARGSWHLLGNLSGLVQMRQKAEKDKDVEGWFVLSQQYMDQIQSVTWNEFDALWNPDKGPVGIACFNLLLSSIPHTQMSFVETMMGLCGVDIWLMPGAYLSFDSLYLARQAQPKKWRGFIRSLSLLNVWGPDLLRQELLPLVETKLNELLHLSDHLGGLEHQVESFSLARVCSPIFSTDSRSEHTCLELAWNIPRFVDDEQDFLISQEQWLREIDSILESDVSEERFKRSLKPRLLPYWDAMLSASSASCSRLFAIAQRAALHHCTRLVQLPGFFLASVCSFYQGDEFGTSMMRFLRSCHTELIWESLSRPHQLQNFPVGPALSFSPVCEQIMQIYTVRSIPVLRAVFGRGVFRGHGEIDFDEYQVPVMIEELERLETVEFPPLSLDRWPQVAERVQDFEELSRSLQSVDNVVDFMHMAHLFRAVYGRRITEVSEGRNAFLRLRDVEPAEPFQRLMMDYLGLEIAQYEALVNGTVVDADLNRNLYAFLESMRNDDMQKEEAAARNALEPVQEGMQRMLDPRGEECSVCFEKCSSDTPLWPCAHALCVGCYCQMVTDQCPVCKRVLRVIDISTRIDVIISFPQ